MRSISSKKNNEEPVEPTKKNLGGRPKGTSEKKFKRLLREYTSDKEIKEFVMLAKEHAKTDKKMLQFILDHLFGKPRQTMGVDGGEGKPITMAALLDTFEKPQNAIPVETIEAEVTEFTEELNNDLDETNGC